MKAEYEYGILDLRTKQVYKFPSQKSAQERIDRASRDGFNCYALARRTKAGQWMSPKPKTEVRRKARA